MKKCDRCNIELPINLFHKDKTRPDGLLRYCKSCLKIARTKRIEKEREWARNWEAKNRAEMNEHYLKKVVKFHRYKTARTKSGRYGKYNVTVERIQRLMLSQKGKCYYCKVVLNGGNMHVEHFYPRSNYKIVLSCADCNRLKWTKNGDEFILFLKEYISRFSLK